MSPSSAYADTCIYTGNASNSDLYNPTGDGADWFDPRNWDTHVPTAADDAVIGNFPVHIDSDVTVNNLTFAPTGNYSLTLRGVTVTIGGTFNWMGGSFAPSSGANNGTVHIIGSAKWNMSGSASKNIFEADVTFINDGTATLSGGPLSIYQSNGRIVNNGTFTLTDDTNLTVGSNNAYQPNGFVNNGVFRKNGGSDTSNVDWIFVNHGVVDAQTGTIAFTGDSSIDLTTTAHDGTFNTAAGATIDFANGTNFFGSDARFIGAGRTRLTGGVVATRGNPQIGTSSGASGTFEMLGGRLNPTSGNGGQGISTSGALVCSQGSTFILNGGNMGGPINIASGGTAQWTNGEVDGTLNIASGATLAISGTGTRTIQGYGLANYGSDTLPGIINNEGTTTWSGTCNIDFQYGDASGATRGVFNNKGTFIAANDQDLTGGGQFNNTGTFTKSAGSLTRIAPDGNGLVLKNTGLLNVQAGVLSLLNSTHQLLSGTTFGGGGSVRLDSGTYPLSGTYTLGSNSTLQFTGGVLTAPDGTTTVAPATFGGSGTFLWTGGTIAGNVKTGPQVHLALSGTGDKHLTGYGKFNYGNVNQVGVLSNGGGALWTDSGPISAEYGGQINNLAGGIFSAQSTANFGSALSNAGTLNIGTSSTPAVFTVGGSYTQASTGALNLKIAGATAATPQFDQLKVSGSATLAGTLNVILKGGYVPVANTTFVAITHGGASGKFSKVTTSGSTTRYFTALYNSNDVTLQANQYQLSASDVSLKEGNSGTTITSFTVSLSAPCPLPVTVKYATANGTATAGTDYNAIGGTLTFNPGETSKKVTVGIKGDTIDEVDETFLFKLSSATNAIIADGSGTGTIIDDDGAPSLRVSDAKVTEGNSGTLNAAFTITLSNVSSRTITVKYATANGTATAGSDYTAASGTLTFSPGQTSKTVNVAVKGDLIDELDETFLLKLSNPENVTIADGSGTGTIVDDDPTPSVSVNNVSTTEGNSGTKVLAFTVKLSGASSRSVSVKYATANAASNSATAGRDYTATSGTLTFAPGETSKTVNITIKGDTLDEVNEGFNLVLSSPLNATVSTSAGTGVGTIVDDDATPSLSIADASVAEGNSGTKTLVFTVKLSASSGQTVTTNFSTVDGTATAGSDYVAQSGMLTFAPGQTSKTIAIVINSDTVAETNETFKVTLSSAVAATISDGVATGTITNDDGSSAAAAASANSAGNS